MSYRAPRQWGPSGFGGGLTVLGRKLVIFYAALYVLELLVAHWTDFGPLIQQLFLFPLGPGFLPWQIATHPFVQHPQDVFGMVMNLLVFYFFAGDLERVLGGKRFLFFFYSTAIGGALLALPFLGLFNAPFMGMGASIAALVVAFGWRHPHSTILFNFFIPIRGITLVYITVGIEAFRLLARQPGAAVHLGAILVAYLHLHRKLDFLDPWTWRIHFEHWKLERMKRRLKVLQGGKGRTDGEPGGNGEMPPPPLVH